MRRSPRVLQGLEDRLPLPGAGPKPGGEEDPSVPPHATRVKHRSPEPLNRVFLMMHDIRDSAPRSLSPSPGIVALTHCGVNYFTAFAPLPVSDKPLEDRTARTRAARAARSSGRNSGGPPPAPRTDPSALRWSSRPARSRSGPSRLGTSPAPRPYCDGTRAARNAGQPGDDPDPARAPSRRL